MKNIVKILFSLILLFTPVILTPTTYAEEGGTETTAEAPSGENPSDNPIEEPGEQPGSEWSGEIIDPANENITEPTTPVEPATVPEMVITEVTTTVTPPARSQSAPANTSVSAPIINTVESAATEAMPAETAPENTENPENIEEIAKNTESTEDSNVLVPETRRPNTSRKIRLLALLSTTIVLFSGIFFFLLLKIFKLKPLKVKLLKTKKVKKSTETKAKTRAKTKSKSQKSKKSRKSTVATKDTNPLLLPPSH